MAKASSGRRARPRSDVEALRLLVDNALVDSNHEQADAWLDLTETQADKIIQGCRGVAGLKGYRERLLSGDRCIPGAVHAVLMSRGLTA